MKRLKPKLCLYLAATLTVILLDYNDNPPKFLPTSNYTAEANEDNELFSFVLQVSATDADEGQTISYSIGASTVEAFTINAEGNVSNQLYSKIRIHGTHLWIYCLCVLGGGYRG